MSIVNCTSKSVRRMGKNLSFVALFRWVGAKYAIKCVKTQLHCGWVCRQIWSCLAECSLAKKLVPERTGEGGIRCTFQLYLPTPVDSVYSSVANHSSHITESVDGGYDDVVISVNVKVYSTFHLSDS